MKVLEVKDPDEIVDVTFDFTEDLASGETLSAGTPAVTTELSSGAADPDIATMPSGAPTIQSGAVLQRYRYGLDGRTYRVRCRVDTSTGRRLVLSALLPVKTI